MIATRGFLTALECTKYVFGRGSAPDPAGGAYRTPPDLLVGLRGPTSKGRGGEGKERGKRGEGRKREGMGGVRKGRGGEGESKVKTPPPSITAYSPAPDWSNSYRLSVRSY